MKCIICGRTKTFKTEGRVIDGSWYKDRLIPKSLYGGWVCCYRCYCELVDRSEKEQAHAKVGEENDKVG